MLEFLKICPICGYDELDEPPYYSNNGFDPTWEVCSCCGYEFGYDDVDQGWTFKAYREKWIAEGFVWQHDNRPDGWNHEMMEKQLENINKVDYKSGVEALASLKKSGK
ncbi:MAG: hypothetical protein Kapaf2KO_08000 [Candidatus Kapaibacteriales bacterium]